MNCPGYRLLRQENTEEAIEVFTLNVAALQKSWNVDESPGAAPG